MTRWNQHRQTTPQERRTQGRQTRTSIGLVVFAAWLVLTGCTPGPPPATATVTSALSSDWTQIEEPVTYDSQTLYDLVDGQADAFFAYGFEEVTVTRYETGTGTVIDAEVWRLATPADAYGLFTTRTAGTPVDVGNGADADPGRRLAFWQDRYFVQIRARQPVDDADLRRFAETIAAGLPAGGQVPQLVSQLPPEGLVDGSQRFFHQEISIQDVVWLGGQNLLGLGTETDGVLAQYDLEGNRAWLLLVRYPDAGQATAGLEALESGQIEGVVVTVTQDDLLGAVFGPVDEGPAGELLERAL